MRKRDFLTILGLFSIIHFSHASELLQKIPKPNLQKIYNYYASLNARKCDIGEHMPVLKRLAMECPSVTEIGLGLVISTWGLLAGLKENTQPYRRYVGIDIAQPPMDNLLLAKEEAEKHGIIFEFIRGNDLYLDIEPTDLLFIDSMHTYCHLLYELETFSHKVRKYIAMHDTSEPWENRNDAEYVGDYSEYPSHYNKRKEGLWPAVVDFLNQHPEWVLEERLLNCHGFTILKRVQSTSV